MATATIRTGRGIFFNEIIHASYPARHEHSQSSHPGVLLGLDLYQWINYRTFSLGSVLFVSLLEATCTDSLEGTQLPSWRTRSTKFGTSGRRQAIRELTKDQNCVARAGLLRRQKVAFLELLPTTTPSVPSTSVSTTFPLTRSPYCLPGNRARSLRGRTFLGH